MPSPSPSMPIEQAAAHAAASYQPGNRETFQLAPEDLGFFAEHGWYNAPPVLGGRAMADARAAVARFYQGERTSALPPAIRASSNWSPADGDVLRMNEFIVQQCEGVALLALAPVIGMMAAQLLGVRGVRVFSSSLVSKPPNLTGPEGVVGWHADSAYWLTCSGRLITAWIPLADCNEESGTLLMVDGSHRWSDTSADVRALRLGRSFRGDGADRVWSAIEKASDRVEVVAMNLRAGQVHFHDGRTLHGSALNRSPSPRLAVIVELQELDNAYRTGLDPHSGKPYVCNTDRVCRKIDGVPDYGDPFYCPVVWAA